MNQENLCLCCDWYSWAFLYDDQLDQMEFGRHPEQVRAFQDHLLALLQHPHQADPSQEGPGALALLDIWQRLCQLISPSWQQRFLSHLTDLFAAISLETAHRAHRQILSVQDYITLRRRASGMYNSFDLIEALGTGEMPSSLYENRSIQDLLQTACDIICWTNDVYSLQKEVAAAELHNLVVVVEQTQGSVQAAVNQVCGMIETQTHRFQQMVEHFPLRAFQVDYDLPSYLADVSSLIGGNLDWSRQTGRYNRGEDFEPGRSKR